MAQPERQLMTTLQFWTLLFGNLPNIATFILTLVGGLLILWRQSVNVKETKALVQSGTNDNAIAIQGAQQSAVEAKTAAVAAAQTAVEAKESIANVHAQINGRMDELIATTAIASHSQGMADQRADSANEKIVIGHNE
jgi:hypothetical protein